MSKPVQKPQTGESAGQSFSSLLSSRKFLCLMGAVFLAYANIAVFFGFYDHLRTLPIDPADNGLLIGALAATALIVRPLISPFFHAQNARPLLFLGTFMAVAALAAYSWADGFWSMLLVRIFHGISFAVVGTALMALIVEVVPKQRSAQFFGYIAVVTLLPNTLVPPFLPFLGNLLGGFNGILLAFAALTLLIFPLIGGIEGKRKSSGSDTAPSGLSGREIADNLCEPGVILLLASMLMLYCGHALIFFFLDGYGKSLGIGFAGVFLTLSTAGEIGVRLVAGRLFDQLDKVRLSIWTLVALCLCYLLLAWVPGKGNFFVLGLLFGLCWGIAMPVFNGLMFEISRPRFRAFNINLGLQMFQAGFFFGPIIGAFLLSQWGYGAIYVVCAVMSLLAAALMYGKKRLQQTTKEDSLGTTGEVEVV